MVSSKLRERRIPELSNGAVRGAWRRIDWIGEVRKQVNSDGRPAFEVKVVLSEIHRGFDRHIFSTEAVIPGRPQIELWVSTDILPAINIGSVWCDGVRVDDLPKALRVVPFQLWTHDRFVALGDKIANPHNTLSNWPIPESAFKIARTVRWHSVKHHMLLACGLRDDSSDEYAVLIPAIELARYYACATSLLTRALFAGLWPSLEWLPGSQPTIVDGVAYIGQNQVEGLCRRSGWLQGRYKFSPQMRYWVDQVGQLLSSAGTPYANATDGARGLKFGFPFDVLASDFTLECETVPIYFRDTDRKRYLVTRIVGCNAPFPFGDLVVHPLLHPGQVEGIDRESLKGVHISAKGKRESAKEKSETAPNPSDRLGPANLPPKSSNLSARAATPNANSPAHILNEMDERFGFLTGRKETLAEKDDQKHKYVTATIALGDAAPDQLSANPSKGAKSNDVEGQVTTLADDIFIDPSSRLQLFIDALALLRGDPAAKLVSDVSSKFALSTAVGTFHRGHYLLNLRAIANRPSAWHFSTPRKVGETTMRRSRQLLFVRVAFNNGLAYLFGEIQARPPAEGASTAQTFSVFAGDVSGLDRDSLNEIVSEVAQYVADNQGWPTWKT